MKKHSYKFSPKVKYFLQLIDGIHKLLASVCHIIDILKYLTSFLYSYKKQCFCTKPAF